MVLHDEVKEEADDCICKLKDIDFEAQEKKIRFSATIKTWLIIAITSISLGISIGNYVWSSTQNAKDIVKINEILSKLPPPGKVANKELIDLEFKNVQESLKRIEESIKRVSNQFDSHQRDTIKMYQNKGK